SPRPVASGEGAPGIGIVGLVLGSDQSSIFILLGFHDGSARPICLSALSPVTERGHAWSSSPLLARLAFRIVDGACLAPSGIRLEHDRSGGDRRRRGRSRGRNRVQLAVRAL